MNRMPQAAVSGSFHRYIHLIYEVVWELRSRNVRVLSPEDPRVVAADGEFLFVVSDWSRSVRVVQDRHLEAIKAADFLWLVCPDGYLGQSASMELGFAVAHGVSVYSLHKPADLTLSQYVQVVQSIGDAIRMTAQDPERPRKQDGFLIDPHASLARAAEILERIDEVLRLNSHHGADLFASRLYGAFRELGQICPALRGGTEDDPAERTGIRRA
jgi:hypothetical protein